MAPDAPVVVSLSEAKKQIERRNYAALVLGAYDDFEHADKREFLERKAAAENASRQRL